MPQGVPPPEPGSPVPLPLDLIEMGLPEGLEARLVAVEPCPAIRPGPGCVVLTTVNHLNPDVRELVLRDEQGRRQTVRPTGLHKFYSQTRDAWVSAKDLRRGEQLRGLAGPVYVADLAPLPSVERVYNFTVEGEHCYRVSTLGALVHNNDCFTPSSGGAPSNSGKYLLNNWHKGTFPNRTQSIKYHLAKHGKGRTALQYTKDAMNFFKKNKNLGTKVILKDGTSGIKIQTKINMIGQKTRKIGGYWTHDGKLVTFWD